MVNEQKDENKPLKFSYFHVHVDACNSFMSV